MGNYYFQAPGVEEEIKAEFSFAYRKNEKGELKIQLHHSSFPYRP
jgi:hypothetical protein